MGKKIENHNNLDKPKRKHSFRLASKSIFLTYPKCKISKENAMAKLKKKKDTSYICVSHELHQDQTDHLHAIVQYSQKFTTTNSNFYDLHDSDEDIIYHGNYQGAKDSTNVREYVMKSGDFIEDGMFMSNNQSAVQKRAADNKLILTTSLPQLVDSGDVSIYNYQQLRTAKNLYTLDSLIVPDYMPKECFWIYGSTGIGKSRWVRTQYSGQFFSKAQNKWWDGYNGEKIVLLDDFDLKGEMLGHLLKIWADCYSFSAEIKGGTIKPVITHFIITSQYQPKDIWCQGSDPNKWDDQLRQAVERRFKMKTIDLDGVTLIDY